MVQQQYEGKVALITGASTGIGKATAEALAAKGMHVFLACRSEEKATPVVNGINQANKGNGKAEYLPLDLGDLESVRQCVSLFLAKQLPLHLLIANAGLAGQKGMTASGFELAFGTCHVGHFLLTNLLLETLVASEPSRIVVVSSQAHKQARDIDFAKVRRPTQGTLGLKEYSVAKLANVLFAAELARRLKGSRVTTYSLHPGAVASDVWRSIPWPLDKIMKLFMLSVEDGAKTTLYCATDPRVAEESGLYYDESRVAKPASVATDGALAKKLWDESERWVRLAG